MKKSISILISIVISTIMLLSTASIPANAETSSYSIGIYSISYDKTNFRSGASLNYPVLCLLNKNEQLSIIETCKNSSGMHFGKANYKGQVGWVRLDSGFTKFLLQPKASTSNTTYSAPVANFPNTGGYLGWLGKNPSYRGKYHVGIDIKANTDSVVYSILDGEVVMAGMYSGYGANGLKGGAVVIKHVNKSGTAFYALYGHINYSVSVGQKVSNGQQIGKINTYTPSHLHFGINTDKADVSGYQTTVTGFVNPASYLEDNCK